MLLAFATIKRELGIDVDDLDEDHSITRKLRNVCSRIRQQTGRKICWVADNFSVATGGTAVSVASTVGLESGQAVAIQAVGGILDTQFTTLTTAIDATQTTGIVLSVTTGFETAGVLQCGNELIRYTAEHLQREEHLMGSLHFPNLVRHKEGHDKFMEKIRDLKKLYDGGSITVASQLSTVLRDWLSLHIRRNDKEILTFVKKTRAKKG